VNVHFALKKRSKLVVQRKWLKETWLGVDVGEQLKLTQ
jgi:hypothetical protein